MKNFCVIFFNTVLLFLFINIIIFIAWPIYSSKKKVKNNYTDQVKQLINLSENDLDILYAETWKNYHKFKFVPFLGHTETDRYGKFVNFSEVNGRKINNSKNCFINIFLYGGSTTFGYNVTDQQTIGHYLEEFLDDKFCVYQHGRAYYYSKQENNLFINHIEEGRKIDYAIFLDGVNERCNYYEYANYLAFSFNNLVTRPYKMWMGASENFIFSLPIYQLYNSLTSKNRWVKDVSNNILDIDSCENKKNISKVFEDRVKVREGICIKFDIKCISYLQPFAGRHGKHPDKLLNEETKKQLLEKYTQLSLAYGIKDIGNILNSNKGFSYVDAVHYSPEANKIIATEISKDIF